MSIYLTGKSLGPTEHRKKSNVHQRRRSAAPQRLTFLVARPARSSRPSASMWAGAKEPSAFFSALCECVFCCACCVYGGAALRAACRMLSGDHICSRPAAAMSSESEVLAVLPLQGLIIYLFCLVNKYPTCLAACCGRRPGRSNPGHTAHSRVPVM